MSSLQERAMLHDHGTRAFDLKPGSIVSAALADLRNRDRKKSGEVDRAAPYAFHRVHVRKAKTAAELLAVAIADRERGETSRKINTRRIYSDAETLAQAQAQAQGA